MTLKKICKIVRKTIEEDCEKNDWIGDSENLWGACGYASYGLYRMIPGSVLVIGSYKAKHTLGFTHCWVETEDKIIDLTATQFGLQSKIYILKKNGNRAKKYTPKMKGKKAIIELNSWDYPANWKINLSRRLKRKIARLIEG
jgi:hypothetical protein